MNSVKETHNKNRKCYFFEDMINTKDLDLNKIKIYKKLYKNIIIYYISYATASSVNPFYLIVNKNRWEY